MKIIEKTLHTPIYLFNPSNTQVYHSIRIELFTGYVRYSQFSIYIFKMNKIQKMQGFVIYKNKHEIWNNNC